MILIRNNRTSNETTGWLICDQLCGPSIELPWDKNIQQISCIPAGLYNLEWTLFEQTTHHYKLTNTTPRTAIYLHHYGITVSQTKGCILIPKYYLEQIENYLATRPTTLEIIERF